MTVALASRLRASFAPLLRRGYCAMSAEVVTGLNISKQGQDPPLKPDEDLPEWLWELAEPGRSVAELVREDFESLSLDEKTRLVKLDKRQDIKQNNVLKAK